MRLVIGLGSDGQTSCHHSGEAIGNEVKDDEFELEDIFDGFAMAAKFRPASRRLLST